MAVAQNHPNIGVMGPAMIFAYIMGQTYQELILNGRSHSSLQFGSHFFYHPNLEIWTMCKDIAVGGGKKVHWVGFMNEGLAGTAEEK